MLVGRLNFQITLGAPLDHRDFICLRELQEEAVHGHSHGHGHGAGTISAWDNKRNRGLGAQRGRGNAQTRGGGRGRGNGRGRKQATEKSAVELDKELESYHAEARQT